MRSLPSMRTLAGSVLALFTAIGSHAHAAVPATAPQAANEEQAAAARHPYAAVREVIARTLEEAKVPSIAVAVVKDGRIIWEEGFGWADMERRIPATAHTPYSLASITKPITATAIMNLHEAGKLDIDAPIERYLGGIALAGHAGSADGVTARRIMAHSAGLAKYGRFHLDGSTPAGSKETISKFGMTVFPPNTRFEYSNIGMKILDAAVEEVSGSSFGDYLQREIFLPLGMTNSAVGLPSTAPAAVRYDSDRKPMGFYMTDHPGSGDVWASAHDMARFLAFHMGTPLPDQRQVLSPATRAVMQMPASATPMPSPGEPRRDVGANWILSTSNGHPQVWHSGGQPGVSTYMTFYPAQKLGFVLLANSSAPLGRVGQAIRSAIAPELLSAEAEGPLPAPEPIPFRGRWVGDVTNYAAKQPMTLNFGDGGEISVRFADQESTTLQKSAFSHGALTGQFSGNSNIPEAQAHPHQLAITLVLVEDELVGQVVAQGMNENVAFMLPSFVRLRKAEERR